MDHIRYNQRNGKPKHEDAQIHLLGIITEFESTVMFGEVPCYALRNQMIAVIQKARPDVERCTSSMNDLIKYGQPPARESSIVEHRLPNHMDMIDWLNTMSITCHLANLPRDEVARIVQRTKQGIDVTKITNLGFLQAGKDLVARLDSCRVPHGYSEFVPPTIGG